MPSAQHQVTIRRPLYEVFAFVADKANDPRWRPGIAEIERISGEDAGAKYRQVIKGPGGRPIPADFEITVFEPGKRLAFRATAGPVRPEGSFDFIEDGGATQVTFKLDAELAGAKKLMAPMVAKSMRNEVASLDRLKQLLETG
ncbi:MAG: SRPBCC family protein [Gaiellaceae bacterium]